MKYFLIFLLFFLSISIEADAQANGEIYKYAETSISSKSKTVIFYVYKNGEYLATIFFIVSYGSEKLLREAEEAYFHENLLMHVKHVEINVIRVKMPEETIRSVNSNELTKQTYNIVLEQCHLYSSN